MRSDSRDVALEAVRSCSPAPRLRLLQVAEESRQLLRRAGVPAAAYESIGARKLRYYRQRHILSAPLGSGTNAYYTRRHVLEASVARLAGALAEWTLDEAARRDVPSMSEEALEANLITLICDYLENEAPSVADKGMPEAGAAAQLLSPAAGVRSLASIAPNGTHAMRAAPAIPAGHACTSYPLPGGAQLLVPQGHPATDPAVLRRLVEVLGDGR